MIVGLESRPGVQPDPDPHHDGQGGQRGEHGDAGDDARSFVIVNVCGLVGNDLGGELGHG